MQFLFYFKSEKANFLNSNEVNNLKILGISEGFSQKDAFSKLTTGKELPENVLFDNDIGYIKIATDDIVESLKMIINYLWKDEQKHFEESESDTNNANHIFSHLQKLQRYFNIEIPNS